MTSESTLQVCRALILHLVDPAIRSLIFAGAAALGLRILRLHDVSLRLSVWKAVLYAALAMPLLSLFVPALPLPLPRVWARHLAAEGAPVSRTTTEAAFAQPVTALHLPALTPSAPQPQRDTTPRWPAALAGSYLIVAGFLLAKLGLGSFFSGRLRRASRPIHDPCALEILDSQAGASGLSRLPALAESECVSVPVTLGFWRPLILLPVDWAVWEAPALRAVLAHELSHVARMDYRTQILSSLHRSLFWFSPLGWWLHRNLADLAELVSDDSALLVMGDRSRYAELLITFFTALKDTQGRVRWQSVWLARGARAHRRLDRILKPTGHLSPGLRKLTLAGLLLFATPVLCLMAAVRPYFEAEDLVVVPAAVTFKRIFLEVSGAGGGSGVAHDALKPGRQLKQPSSPPAHAQTSTPAAPVDEPTPPAEEEVEGVGSPCTADDKGKSFLIVSGGIELMNCFTVDPNHADPRSKIKGDFIWFRREGKSYVIRDQSTVRTAMELEAALRPLARRQSELGDIQWALRESQVKLGELQSEIRVKLPDFSDDLRKVEAQISKLKEDGTPEDLAEAQAALSTLQSKLGELQAKAGEEQMKLGEQQAALGERQAALGERQAKLDRERERLWRDFRKKIRLLLEGALAKGLAQPE